MMRRLGRYELHDVLGTGSFATVYRATDPSLEATVAVKVLADNWSRDPDLRRRFRAEAVLLRRVQASGSIPGLVEVHDIDEDDSGQPYFVMGYADKGTLARRASTRRWSPADVVPVIEALAETVGALHENGIVHRDLKPSNILLRSDDRAATVGPGTLVARHERVLVGDLGLAKDLRREATSMSFAGGTRLYRAPEQLDPRAPVDHRADVHASSAVILELLTGSPSAEARSGCDPLVGAALDGAIARGLSSAPDERFESMARWRQGLLDAIDVDATRTPAQHSAGAGPGTAPGASAAPRHRRHLALAAAAVLVAMALAWLTVRLLAPGAIVGPDQVVVGETARYRAPAAQDQSITWIGPNGERVSDMDLEVRAIVPGTLRIELVAGGERSARTVVAVPSPAGPSVEGPSRARVGEPVVLRPSSPAGENEHYWLDPSGARVDDEALRLTPRRPGTVSVALVAVGEDGIERGVRHQVEAVP